MKHFIQLLPHQLEALHATEKEILLSGGIGVGKSYTGAIWVVRKITENPKARILIGACTYSQLMNASVKTFTQLLDDLGIVYKATLSGARKRIEIGKAVVYLYSLEKPDSIRGIEVSHAWLDEVAFSTLKALQVVRGRLRWKEAKDRQILLTSSPCGYNWLYDIFGGTKLPKSKKLIRAKTEDNIFLPNGYYSELVEQYGGVNSPLARQELFGEFVNLQEGAIYNLFNRGVNVLTCKLDKRFPVYVGCDFNIDKMSAVYVQQIGGVFYQVKEVQLTHRNSNTVDLSLRIKEDLKDYQFYVVPDSTGNARKSSSTSSKSDHQIMRDMGITVMETYNPHIRDRQNTVNLAFLKKSLVIDPSCTETIKEIETLSNRDKEGKVSHLSVCTGYVLWRLAPLKPAHKPSQTINL